MLHVWLVCVREREYGACLVRVCEREGMLYVWLVCVCVCETEYNACLVGVCVSESMVHVWLVCL